MARYKILKSAVATVLSLSLIAPAFTGEEVTAASKYKVVNGKLYVKKTNKKAPNYVTYKKTLYKNGVKYKGLRKNAFYKAGKKASGTYKGAYYVKGVKKVTTGKFKNSYYVKGVKKVTTGVYGGKYYKLGSLTTGTYKGTYYVKGVKKATTGYYNNAYYVSGVKKVGTGVYNGKLYVNGKENKGYYLYDEKLYNGTTVNKDLILYQEQLYNGAELSVGYQLYKGKLYNDDALNLDYALYDGRLYNDEVLNKGYVIFEDQLYDGDTLNKGYTLFEEQLYSDGELNNGIVLFKDDGQDFYYNDALLADGLHEYNGKEELFEKGIKMTAKAVSVSVSNTKQIKINFNKSVDEATVRAENFVVTGSTFSVPPEISTYTLSADKKSVTIQFLKALAGNYIIKSKNTVKTLAGDSFEAASFNVEVTDRVAPTFVDYKQDSVNSNVFYFEFSEEILNKGLIEVRREDGTVIPNIVSSAEKNLIKIEIPAGYPVGTDIDVTIDRIEDLSENSMTTRVTKTIQVGKKDGSKPYVTEIDNKKSKSFDLYFSEEVLGFTKEDLTVSYEETVSGNKVEKQSKVEGVTVDSTNRKKYTINLETPITGAVRIKVRNTEQVSPQVIRAKSAYTDLSGEAGMEYNQMHQFDTDIVKPVITTSIDVDNDGDYILVFKSSKDNTSINTTVREIELPAEKGNIEGTLIFLKEDLSNNADNEILSVKLKNIKFYNSGGNTGEDLVVGTAYSLTVAKDLFLDSSVTPNSNAASANPMNFIRKADRENAEPDFSDVRIDQSEENPSILKINFGKVVDIEGTADWTLAVKTKANYSIGNHTATNVKVLSKSTIEVTMPEGTMATSKIKYTVKMGNIFKDADSNNPKEYELTLTENKAPTLKVGKITSAYEKDSGYGYVSTISEPWNSDIRQYIDVTYSGTAAAAITFKYDGINKTFILSSVTNIGSNSDYQYNGGINISIKPDGESVIKEGDTFTVATLFSSSSFYRGDSETIVKLTFDEDVKVETGTEYQVTQGGTSTTTARVIAPSASQAKNEVYLSINNVFTFKDKIPLTLSPKNSATTFGIYDLSNNELKLSTITINP